MREIASFVPCVARPVTVSSRSWQAEEVHELISAELVFYFPTGSTICRITSLVVSSQYRGHGLGQKLLTAAIDFAREHHCSGLELTSAEERVDAHRFYRRLGFFPDVVEFFQTV